MDTPMLHLIGPCRDGSPGMIAGDAGALVRLRAAIDMAIANGIGSAELFSSDYEPYDLLVVAPPNVECLHCLRWRSRPGPFKA